MQIESAALSMRATHAQAESRRESVRIEIREGNPQGDGPATRGGSAAMAISAPSSGVSSTADTSAGVRSEAGEDTSENLSSDLRLLKAIVQSLTGQLMKLFDADALQADDAAQPAPQEAPTQLRISQIREYAEAESTSFSASGTIRTRDGMQIEFSLSLSMQRAYLERSSTEIILQGTPRLKDPLVINFDGRAAELTQQRYDFDLDADGQLDQIPGLSSGRAFLVLDSNGDGRVNDGRELVGALSGDAYGDLRALDEDGNGFIDEGDSAFARLAVWRPGEDGLRSLSAAGVGALATAALRTPFKLVDQQNQQLGQLRASSIYVSESGRVGSTQQLDMVV